MFLCLDFHFQSGKVFGITVTMSNVSESDAGEFFCRANNSMGTTYKKITVSVLGSPKKVKYQLPKVNYLGKPNA